MKLTQNKFRLKNIASTGLFIGAIGLYMGVNKLSTPPVLAAPSMLEFRWDNSSTYKKLYYWQSSNIQRDRSTYFLVIRPKDRRTAILKLSISIPKYFDAKITPKNLYLCQIKQGGMLEKTRCEEKIPAVFEVSNKQTSIEVFPNEPIPNNKKAYAVVMKIFNPNQTGMFQLNAKSQSPGDLPISSYVGSWNIDIR